MTTSKQWRAQLAKTASGAYKGQFDESDCSEIIADLESLEAENADLKTKIAELSNIDELLARRPALSYCKTRYDKISFALATAGRADIAERENADLREKLEKAEKAQETRDEIQLGALDDLDQQLTTALLDAERMREALKDSTELLQHTRDENDEGGIAEQISDNKKVLSSPPSEYAREVRETLRDMIKAVETEVNEKGGGGYILARLTDARALLARMGEK
jgi:DNA repair exonuclease SbcCD ATPase subunit